MNSDIKEKLIVRYRELYNGVKIPMLGFGVYQIPKYEDAKQAVLAALKTGYRLIDTAQGYMNEEAVGVAIISMHGKVWKNYIKTAS